MDEQNQSNIEEFATFEERCNEDIFDTDEFDPDEETRCFELLCMII